jgi:hypothetical protein
MVRRLTIGIAVLLVVAACDSDSGKRQPLTSVQGVYDEVRNAGVEVGALEMIRAPGMMTQEKGKAARPDGTDLYIYIPTPTWDRQAFFTMLDVAGGFSTYGNRWVVNVQDRATAEKVANKLGGTVWGTEGGATPATAPTTVAAPATTGTGPTQASRTGMDPALGRKIVAGLKQEGMPIGKSICYNENNDPNRLLGRPGGYEQKCSWADKRVEQYGDIVGGSVEIFETPGLAIERAEYLKGFNSPGPLNTGWTWLVPENSNFVLRVDSDLTRTQANAYHKAMQKVMARMFPTVPPTT